MNISGEPSRNCTFLVRLFSYPAQEEPWQYAELKVPKNKPCKRVTHTAASRLGKQPNKATLRSDLDASCG